MIVKNIENHEEKTATFEVEIDAAEFDAAVNKAYNKNKGSISVPGFRKGKAPRAIIESMYGAEVFYQDAMDELGPEAFEFGVKESGLKIIGKPSISNIDLSEEKVLTYTFEVELYPVVTLGQYRNLSAPKKTAVVTDEQVQEKVLEARKRGGRKVEVERPAEMGDTADIDFDGYLDGVPFEGGKAENYSLELGSATFVPGFEEQVVGMQIGEERDIDITFPENYAPELAGKAVVFKIRLNGLTALELPEFDDEFVQDVSEFDTVDEYLADVREQLLKAAQDEYDGEYRAEIMKMACDNMTCDVPESMIESKVEELLHNYAAQFGIDDKELSVDELMKLMGLDETTMETAVRPAAIAQVREVLLLSAIVDAEGLNVTQEEMEEYVVGAAQSIGVDPETLINYFGAAFIKGEYLKEKAARIIIETADVAEESASEE